MKIKALLEQQCTRQQALTALLMVQQHAAELDCETSLGMHSTAEGVIVLKITDPKRLGKLNVLISRPGAGSTAAFQSRIVFFFDSKVFISGPKTAMVGLDDEHQVQELLTKFAAGDTKFVADYN